LKIKFDAYPFVENQMMELENEVTQYESPNEGNENARGCTNLLHAFILHALKGNEHQAPRTQVMFWNNWYTIIEN
jgi:hypothetical protein